jgi:hypothetical protein
MGWSIRDSRKLKESSVILFAPDTKVPDTKVPDTKDQGEKGAAARSCTEAQLGKT